MLTFDGVGLRYAHGGLGTSSAPGPEVLHDITFKLDAGALADLHVDDVSARTIPKDFERNPRIHRCYEVRFK